MTSTIVVTGGATAAGIAIFLLEDIGNGAINDTCHGLLNLELESIEIALSNVGSKCDVRCGSICINHCQNTDIKLLLAVLDFIEFVINLLVERYHIRLEDIVICSNILLYVVNPDVDQFLDIKVLEFGPHCIIRPSFCCKLLVLFLADLF